MPIAYASPLQAGTAEHAESVDTVDEILVAGRWRRGLSLAHRRHAGAEAGERLVRRRDRPELDGAQPALQAGLHEPRGIESAHPAAGPDRGGADGGVDERDAGLGTGIGNAVARVEIVGAVDHQVISRDDLQRIAGCEPQPVALDRDMRIEPRDRLPARLAGVGQEDDGAHDAIGKRIVRLARGGRILEQIDTGEFGIFAAALGGPDGRSLFMAAAPDFIEANRRARPEGRIMVTRVDVPHAGRP